MKLTHSSLFTGIGVFDLAAENLGFENVFQCEIDSWCSKLLKQNFPAAINHSNIENFDAKKYYKTINVISGGFPCQDISIAGKGIGITGKKSGLWSHYARIISEVNPDFAIIENSPQLLRKGFEKILHDLSEIGYDAEWETISAADYNKCHKRQRLFILAYPTIQRRRGLLHLLKRSLVEKNKETNTLDCRF